MKRNSKVKSADWLELNFYNIMNIFDIKDNLYGILPDVIPVLIKLDKVKEIDNI